MINLDETTFERINETDFFIVEPVEFSGGKGGKPRTASVSGTTTDTATIVLGWGFGEVEGLIGGAKGIYLDGTPVQNADNSFNLKDFDFLFLTGQPTQTFTPVSGNEIASETAVGVQVKQSLPIVRTITTSAMTHIRLRLLVTLQKQDSKGNISGSSVNYSIAIKTGAGAFVTRVNATAEGRYPSGYVITYVFAIDPNANNFTVQVNNFSPDSDDQNTRNLQWLSYAEVSDRRVDYNNQAVLWAQFSALQFAQTPSVWAKFGGIKFDIPVNATLGADRCLTFSGIWGGGLYMPDKAPRDPAWILYGILSNALYGAGLDPSYIDKFSFYDASVYNMGFVPDGGGTGGLERRFTFDAVLKEAKPALQWCREIAAVFDAKLFWNGTSISLWQDRPTVALPRIITNADVIDGNFVCTSQEYAGVTTACTVWWADPDQDYELVPELVRYQEAISRYGLHTETFTALGATTRGQAVRAGRRLIIKTLLNAEMNSFKSRAIATFFAPGEVVQVVDSRRNRRRRSGLIKSATTTQVTIDSPITLTSAAAQVYVTLPDMTTAIANVTNGIGSHSVLNLGAALPVAPMSQASWQILDGSEIVKRYRIVSVSPDRENPNLYEVVGTLDDESLWNLIELGWTLDSFPLQQNPPVVVPVPRDVTAVQRTRSNDVNGVPTPTYGIEAQWLFPVNPNGDKNTFITGYLVEYKLGINGDWIGTTETKNTYFEWSGGAIGLTYYVRVSAISYGRQSTAIESGPMTIAVGGGAVVFDNPANAAIFVMLAEWDDMG